MASEYKTVNSPESGKPTVESTSNVVEPVATDPITFVLSCTTKVPYIEPSTLTSLL